MRDEVDRLRVGRSITSNVEKLISSHGQTPKVAYLNQCRTQNGKGFLEKKVKGDFDKVLKTKFGDSEFA